MIIAPSVLSIDFAKIGKQVRLMDQAGADWFHIDLMDGHFVPNLSFGPIMIQTLKRLTDKPLDCHLMVDNPEELVQPVIDAGADLVTVHVESTPHIHRLLQEIHDSGAKAGVVLNPGTSLETLKPVLDMVDLVLVMSVNPGFGGQTFIEESLDRIQTLAQWRQDHGYDYLIEVDGGINDQTAPQVLAAGADVLVSGSYLFGQEDWAQAIEDFRGLQED